MEGRKKHESQELTWILVFIYTIMGLLSQHLEKPNCEGGTHRPGLHLREAGDVRRRQLPPLGEPGSQTPTGIPAKPQGAPFIDRMLLL